MGMIGWGRVRVYRLAIRQDSSEWVPSWMTIMDAGVNGRHLRAVMNRVFNLHERWDVANIAESTSSGMREVWVGGSENGGGSSGEWKGECT